MYEYPHSSASVSLFFCFLGPCASVAPWPHRPSPPNTRAVASGDSNPRGAQRTEWLGLRAPANSPVGSTSVGARPDRNRYVLILVSKLLDRHSQYHEKERVESCPPVICRRARSEKRHPDIRQPPLSCRLIGRWARMRPSGAAAFLCPRPTPSSPRVLPPPPPKLTHFQPRPVPRPRPSQSWS